MSRIEYETMEGPSTMGIKTTNAQYQNLINILTDRQDIAHGITRRSKDELGTFWVFVATELNNIGPPTKDPIAWRKVWSDYKSYVKKKLVQNKKEIEVTDGKPRKLHFLNSLEQKVVRISGLEKYIKLVNGKVLISFEEGRLGTNSGDQTADMNMDIPSPSAIEIKNSNKSNNKSNHNHKSEDMNIFDREDSIEKSLRDPSILSYVDMRDTELEINLDTIKSDVLRQNETFQDMIIWTEKTELYNKRLSHNLKKICKALYHVYVVRKCMLRETIRHNREVEKIMKKRLKIKETLLEIKKSRKT